MKLNLTEEGEGNEPLMRPTLLTVLCILTFIGSGWGIISNIWAYSTAQKTAHLIENVSKINKPDSTYNQDSVVTTPGRKKGLVFREKLMLSFSKLMTAENIRKNAVGSIISSIFTLLGAFLMWNLDRKGFYIYITGILIGIIVPLYFYGTGLSSISIAVFPGFFGLLFIVLYGLNIRSLR